MEIIAWLVSVLVLGMVAGIVFTDKPGEGDE